MRQPGTTPRSPSRAFALSLASIALVSPLAVHLFIPAIPAVKAALQLSEAHAQLTFSISLFGMAFATLAYGSLSDRYGRRPVLLSGLILFLFGSIISAVTTTVGMLVVGRLIQAIGAGCATTLVRTIARDAYGPERLVRAIAHVTMFYTLGPMVSPFVGGILIDTVGWRAVFAFAFVTGGIITFGAYRTIHETHYPGPAKQSLSGVFRSYWQLTSQPRFTAFVLQSGFSTGAFMTLASASSTIMKEFLNRPSTEFGIYFLFFPAGFFFGNMFSGWISGRRTTEGMVLAGSLLTITAVLGQAVLLLWGYATPITIFVPGFFLTMAQGIALPYAQSGAMATIPRLAGTAAGIGVFTQHFCGALFAQFYGLVANGTPRPMVATTVLAAVLCLAVGVLPSFISKRETGTASLRN